MDGCESNWAVASQNGRWQVKTGGGKSKWVVRWAKTDGCEWKQVGEGENGGSGLKRVVRWAKTGSCEWKRVRGGESGGQWVEAGAGGSKRVLSMVLGWGSKWVGTAENGCGIQNGWGAINAVGQAGPGGVDRVVSIWCCAPSVVIVGGILDSGAFPVLSAVSFRAVRRKVHWTCPTELLSGRTITGIGNGKSSLAEVRPDNVGECKDLKSIDVQCTDIGSFMVAVVDLQCVDVSDCFLTFHRTYWIEAYTFDIFTTLDAFDEEYVEGVVKHLGPLQSKYSLKFDITRSSEEYNDF
ncbi:hypothetical protein BYT27DRAFT_7212349 [Phlegmacium glaucopus]|nr:hypothetical protein BYT27DRAFT_7212349 [Phlegmacium glaucopus]